MANERVTEIIELSKKVGRLETDNYYREKLNNLIEEILCWVGNEHYSEGERNVMRCIVSALLDILKSKEDFGDYPGVVEDQFDNMTGSMNL